MDRYRGKSYKAKTQGYMDVEHNIKRSMEEETKAAKVYRARAKEARAKGFTRTAALWEHIAGEEDQHWKELSEELSKIRKGVV